MSLKAHFYNHIDINKSAERAILRANRMYHSHGIVGKTLGLLQHRHNRKKYGIEIYPEATLGSNLRIPHAVGIVIGKTSVIGDNVTIFPGAMVIAKYSPKTPNPEGRRHAVIESDCILGAGCMVIGDIVIGKGSTIGAGAIVTKDVPPYSTVINVNCCI